MDKKPTQTNRQKQKIETRDLILKTARELFLDRGYEKTTMRDIANKAGLGTGTAFTHFPDKRSILAATLYNDIEDALNQAFESLPPNSSIIEMLVHPVRMIFEHFAKTPQLSKTLLKETLFMQGPWGKRVDIQLQRSIELTQKVLEDLKNNGQLRADSNCEILALGVISHYLSILYWGLAQDIEVEKQVNIFQLLLESLLIGHISG
ncbi:MAG: TetR/AcrR family transcriptional regulator [Desulfobacterales bacterium]|nr:TetR/AcrR family transcriptional regulator [Desulfobacterales bacterium]